MTDHMLPPQPPSITPIKQLIPQLYFLHVPHISHV